jgi:PAS domain S-box-containing protein
VTGEMSSGALSSSRLLHESAAAEARFRGLIEVAPDAIVTADGDGRIVLVNGQTEALFGYQRAEMLGQFVEVLLPERYREGHVSRRSGYTHSPRIRPMGANLELHGRRKDGSEFPVEISLGPIEVDGELLVIATIRDISERKAVEAAIVQAREEAVQANLAKSEFLSRMSHELRTPLNAILGFGQLLAMDDLIEEQRDSVDQILRAGAHLLELINEVLDISRIEAGRLTLSIEPVSLDDLLRETQDLVRPLANEAHIRIEETPRPSSMHVLADQQRLRQVLLNLLTNAVKYNRADGLVQITCEPGESGQNRIAIRDTGNGMDEGELARLFTPFERLAAEQSGVEGTGLGLALSRRLVEAMNGSMGVESTKGMGSTFWLDLPASGSAIDLVEVLPPEAVGPVVEAAGPTKTVLYIEDNLASFQLMDRIFARWTGVKLISAMQGRLGVDLAMQHHPDLVLLDLHLPDIHGYEVLQRLRGNDATRDIPIIVTSADATSGQIERLLEAGADDYLTKPLDIPQFTEAVRKHLA